MSDDTGNRLQAIQEELASILDSRLNELTQAMKTSETLTRRLLAAELELERHNAGHGQLTAEIASMEAELAGSRDRLNEVREQHAEFVTERDRARSEVTRMEREVREIDGEVEQSRKRVRELEATAESLRKENTSLKAKLITLEENVTRMRQLQKELMSSISGLSSQMAGLTSADKE